MKMRWLLATMAFGGLMASSTGQIKVLPYQYEVANYLSGPHSDALRIFPSKGNAIMIALPFSVRSATFGPDGKSIYGIIADSQRDAGRDQPGLSRVEFNPTRVTPVPGTSGFIIKSFAFSSRQDKLVISGNLQHADGRDCGVFEILIPDGNVRQVLSSDCDNQRSWDHLSLSSNGDRAIATAGSNMNHDLHLELIDLVHGTTTSLGDEFWMGVWSPDGKWIAARESGRRDRLVLMDAVDFSRRRALGGAVVLAPAWSPNSRYLLLWKEYLFRCGIYPDLEPPATLEMLDIQTGRRSAIQSSRCQITAGPTGWVSSEITK